MLSKLKKWNKKRQVVGNVGCSLFLQLKTSKPSYHLTIKKPVVCQNITVQNKMDEPLHLMNRNRERKTRLEKKGGILCFLATFLQYTAVQRCFSLNSFDVTVM